METHLVKFVLLVIFCINFSAAQVEQKLTLVYGEKIYQLPIHLREGQVYFSALHFAEAMTLKHKFDEKSGTLEIQFDNYSLQTKIKNPFLVLKDKRDNSINVVQLPTTTYYINKNLYLPLIYTLPSLIKVSGFKFEQPDKYKVLVRSEPIANDKVTDTPALSFGITGFTLDEKANGTLVRVKSNKAIAFYNSSFEDGVLKVVFRDVNLDESKFNVQKKKGLITNIKGRNIGSDCEIQFSLREEFTSSEILNAPKGNDILITLHNKIFSANADRNIKAERWNFDVVVIDAGHGGKDHGAIGINGAKEKDINLAIALKLGKMIEKELKDVKVVYTRKDDSFVELYKRGKIANENDGKLFISIHCNSTAKKNSDANGFEVYLLRPGKTQDAIDIAEQENAVIKYESDPQRYQKLTDENFILVSMAHSAYMKYSEKFAELLHLQFSNDSKVESRGVKQAGFYVLVGASMPSVLIETGFLSHKREAEYLKSTKGQEEIAAAIFRAVKGYKTYYEKVVESEL